LDMTDGRRRFLLAGCATAFFVQILSCAVSLVAFRVEPALMSLVVAVATLAAAVLSAAAVVRVAISGRASFFQTWSVFERGAAAILCGAATFSLFGYAWQQVQPAPDHRARGLLFVSRVISPSNGVSPAGPIVAVAAALFLWSMLNLRRVGMPRHQQV